MICSMLMPPTLLLMKRTLRSMSTSISVSAAFAVVARSNSSERRNRASESRLAVTSWITPTKPAGAPPASNKGRAMAAYQR